MRYQAFGRRCGLRISEQVLGTANFGAAPTAAGDPAIKEIFASFVNAGGTTFDSSSRYHGGEAETRLGQLLGHERDDFVIITKYGAGSTAPARPGTTGNSRKVMVRSLEESLRRLRTDHVDLFMPHLPDAVTPMPEILAGLESLIQAGKVRYGGLSNFPAWRVAGAATAAELGGLSALAGIQTEYSLAERSAERELLPAAEAHGLGVLAYSPLAGGLLTGKYRRGEEGRLSRHSGGDVPAETDRRERVVDAVVAVAEELGVSPVGVALAWLRDRASVLGSSLAPVVGPRTASHLAMYLAALDVELGAEHRDRLTQAAAFQHGPPYDTVDAALRAGVDGDRALLRTPRPVVV